VLKTRLHSREAAQQCNPAGSLRLQSMNAYDELPVPPSYQGRVAPLAYFCPVRYTPERMGYASLRRNCGCCARTPSIHSLGTADQELTTGTFNGFARSPSPTTPPAPVAACVKDATLPLAIPLALTLPLGGLFADATMPLIAQVVLAPVAPSLRLSLISWCPL